MPDVYQGDELEALSLVDPDNRRPVDWGRAGRRWRACAVGRRRATSASASSTSSAARWRCARAGRPRSRARYEPVAAGPGVCAYLRGGEVLVVVPVRDWETARVVVPGRWRSALDERDAIELGEGASVAELTGAWPVALLERA